MLTCGGAAGRNVCHVCDGASKKSSVSSEPPISEAMEAASVPLGPVNVSEVRPAANWNVIVGILRMAKSVRWSVMNVTVPSSATSKSSPSSGTHCVPIKENTPISAGAIDGGMSVTVKVRSAANCVIGSP